MISRNLLHRILTGLPLAAAAIWYIFLATEPIFIAITIAIGIIAIYEYGSAFTTHEIPVRLPFLYVLQALLFASFWFFIHHQIVFAAALFLILLGVLALVSISKNARRHRAVLWYVFPLCWILIPLCLLYLLRFRLIEERGSQLIFFILLVAAFNDIFAYFGGKRFGKHLLAPVISPKKTIEGSAFGISGGLLGGLTLSTLWLSDLLPFWKSAFIIIILVIASQLGDLIESKFKRFCGIKDSSNLIPGHGGLLDRIDAYLLALPVFIGLIYILNVV